MLEIKYDLVNLRRAELVWVAMRLVDKVELIY